jgi:radical SAM superfamily enzyme YgiQ (UPF0313 family)
MKILFVDPPGKNKGLNTGLGYLSAVLKKTHKVNILDLNNIRIGLCGDPNPEIPLKELEKRIIAAMDEYQPDLFGISVKTFTAQIAKHILKVVKDKKPEVSTIVGGPHITLDGYNFILENKVDFGIQGEGEYSTPKLCNAITKRQPPDNINGIYYWENGKLIHNPRNNAIKNLDNLPFPSYETFSSVIHNDGRLREYPLLTSRGCPFNCSYCSMPKIMGNKWRSHTSARVIKELKHAKQKYHSKSFTVVDDNFTLNLKRVEDISDSLISENINLPWNSQNGIRADRITQNLAEKMKRSGCHYVWIGIENADDNVFSTINKGEKLEDIKIGIKHLKRAGIRVGGFFIIGLPHSTRQADLKSIGFVNKNGIDGWWFNFVPYPHTQAYKWVKAHGKHLRPTDGALQFGTNSIEPVFETEEYPKESRIKTYNEIHISLKYFDRLVDPSLKQLDKWRKVFKTISPYGFLTVLSLLIFIIKYNSSLLKNKFTK